MPIEIREIIIKTEISVNESNQALSIKEKELSTLKSQLLEELKRITGEQSKKKVYKR
jgi:Family of unknown function (DUF5908)